MQPDSECPSDIPSYLTQQMRGYGGIFCLGQINCRKNYMSIKRQKTQICKLDRDMGKSYNFDI